MRHGATVVIGLLVNGAAVAGGVAPWAPLDSFPAKTRLALSKFQEVYCTPDREEVLRPIFPDAMILALDWPKKKPHCDAPVDPKQFGGLELVSREPHEAVENWYAARLKAFSRFQIEAGVIFVKGERQDFDWNRDAHAAPYVLVMPARQLWREGGFETVIEMSLPAL